MPFTADEQFVFFEQMYGCNPHEFKESVEQSTTFKVAGPHMIIASILSDAQELVQQSKYTPSAREEARRTINLAKFLIAEYFSPRPEEC